MPLRRVDRATRSRSSPRRSCGRSCRTDRARRASPTRRHTPPSRMVEMQDRALRAVREIDARILETHGKDAVWVAVSHGDVIKSILSHATGAHLDDFQRINVDPASVSVVRYTSRKPFVLRLNDVGGDLDGAATAGEARRRGGRRRRGRGRRDTRKCRIGSKRMTVQDFDPADRFVAGTVGPAGQRAFYLQASAGPRVVTVGAREAAGLGARRPHQRRARPARARRLRSSRASPVGRRRTPSRCRRRSTRTGTCRPSPSRGTRSAQRLVIECHDHDPDEVDDGRRRRGGSARAQLDPGRPDAGRGPRLRPPQQRARRRRSARRARSAAAHSTPRATSARGPMATSAEPAPRRRST